MSSLTILIWSLSLTGFSNSNRAILWAIVVRSYPGCKTILFTETGVSVPSNLLRLKSPKDSSNNYRHLNNLAIKGTTRKKKLANQHAFVKEQNVNNTVSVMLTATYIFFFSSSSYGNIYNVVRANSYILKMAAVWLLLFGKKCLE